MRIEKEDRGGMREMEGENKYENIKIKREEVEEKEARGGTREMEGADKNEERGKQRVLSQSEAKIRERRERRSEREEREREKRRRGERAEGERWRGGRNTFGREHRQEPLEVGRKRNRKRQRREEEGERVTKELNSCKSILSLPFV